VTAPVRRPDSRGDARAGGPDPGASDHAPLSERLALRNWSLPVKLAAVLLVPTIFVITLGVLATLLVVAGLAGALARRRARRYPKV